MHKGQSREGIVEDYKSDNPKELQTQMLVEVRLVIYWAGFNTQELVRPMASKNYMTSEKRKSLTPTRLFATPWNSPGQNTRVGSLSLLQGIFPTQELNPGLPHCGQILYQLSHKGHLKIQEWVPILSPGDLLTPGIVPGSWKKQESSRKTSISALLTMPKPWTVWITINCGKL